MSCHDTISVPGNRKAINDDDKVAWRRRSAHISACVKEWCLEDCRGRQASLLLGFQKKVVSTMNKRFQEMSHFGIYIYQSLCDETRRKLALRLGELDAWPNMAKCVQFYKECALLVAGDDIQIPCGMELFIPVEFPCSQRSV